MNHKQEFSQLSTSESHCGQHGLIIIKLNGPSFTMIAVDIFFEEHKNIGINEFKGMILAGAREKLDEPLTEIMQGNLGIWSLQLSNVGEKKIFLKREDYLYYKEGKLTLYDADGIIKYENILFRQFIIQFAESKNPKSLFPFKNQDSLTAISSIVSKSIGVVAPLSITPRIDLIPIPYCPPIFECSILALSALSFFFEQTQKAKKENYSTHPYLSMNNPFGSLKQIEKTHDCMPELSLLVFSVLNFFFEQNKNIRKENYSTNPYLLVNQFNSLNQTENDDDLYSSVDCEQKRPN